VTTELAPASSVALRDVSSAGPTLYGHFARFDEWAVIDSIFEGHFLERFARGAFAKTIAEDRARMRVLFGHGHDGLLGLKPLGRIAELREDDQGAYYEASLYAGIPQLLLEGLRDGAYGASFRFSVLREDIDHTAPKSARNPEGLPERTVVEARVREFGPVTFPAYQNATADVRSEGPPERVGFTRERVLRGDEKVTPVMPLEVAGEQLIPGRSRLAVKHEWVRQRPEDFRPCWSGDVETRAALERMRGRGRSLPLRSPTSAPLRLPSGDHRPLRLPGRSPLRLPRTRTGPWRLP
jgi:HK97 family phage prohead protease